MRPLALLLNPLGLALSQTRHEGEERQKGFLNQQVAHLIANRHRGRFLDRVLIPARLLVMANGLLLCKSITYGIKLGRGFLDRVLIHKRPPP